MTDRQKEILRKEMYEEYPLYTQKDLDEAIDKERKEIIEKLKEIIPNLKHCHSMLRSARKDIAGLSAIDLEMKIVLDDLENLSK